MEIGIGIGKGIGMGIGIGTGRESILTLIVGMFGWGYESRHQDNGDLGQRIYREAPNALGKGKRASGKKAVSPPAPLWETVSTTLEEVQEFEVRMSISILGSIFLLLV